MSVAESETEAKIACWIKPCHPLGETQKKPMVIMPSIEEGGRGTSPPPTSPPLQPMDQIFRHKLQKFYLEE